jgi:hypothetical protein
MPRIYRPPRAEREPGGDSEQYGGDRTDLHLGHEINHRVTQPTSVYRRMR